MMQSTTSEKVYPNIVENEPYEITRTSFGLGILFGVAVGSLPLLKFKSFNLYIVALSLFHFLEYYTTAKHNPRKVNAQSFLLNNGMEYTGAHTLAILECLLETWLCPSWKSYNGTPAICVVAIGLLCTIMGQIIRSMAMITAGNSFSHVIKTERAQDHHLVTGGVYSVFRHPSYFGFFWWALGTQLMLLNPISFVIFTVVLYKFFSRRIRYEETHLVQFFGQKYKDYQENVKIWIPFI